MSSFSPHHDRRRRQRRSAASAVATTAATAAVAYGTYRLAQWYWNEDDESEEGTEHPLEEDLPSFFAQEEHAGKNNGNRNGDQESSNPPPRSTAASSNYSWMSTAAVGVASWLADASTASRAPPGGPVNNNGFASRSPSARSRPQPTRRQKLIRCRGQTRVAFQTCFQTLKPVVEDLTDSSRQTKDLKVLRRRRQALKQREEQPPEQQQNGGSDGDGPTSSGATDKKEFERELQALQDQEEELWREILVETTTRMMASSYAYALLLLSLTVQFHWLASTLEFHPDSTEDQQQEQEALLMRSHRYLLNEGIPLLVPTVRRSLERVLFGGDETDEYEGSLGGTGSTNNNSTSLWEYPSSQFVTSEDVERTLYRQLPRVLDDIGAVGRQRHRRRNWIRFVLPDEEVFDPVWDICRSPVWEDAQEQVLAFLWYDILRDGESIDNPKNWDSSQGWGKVFRTNGKSDADHSDDNGKKKSSKHHHHQQQQQPLAKVMAHFKKAASSLFEETVNSEDDGRGSSLRGETRSTLAGRLQTLPTVLELGDITFQ
jgi:hypothetical protein